jgi:hypothetical protein
MKCATCKHWSLNNTEWYRDPASSLLSSDSAYGHGRCDFAEMGPLDKIAYVRDGSDYAASLHTKPEFFCAAYEFSTPKKVLMESELVVGNKFHHRFFGGLYFRGWCTGIQQRDRDTRKLHDTRPNENWVFLLFSREKDSSFEDAKKQHGNFHRFGSEKDTSWVALHESIESNLTLTHSSTLQVWE